MASAVRPSTVKGSSLIFGARKILPMKLHVLGVPHTISRKHFSTCAFTQKVVNLCAMMSRRGHEVIHYGVEGAEVEASERVDIVSKSEWSAHYSKPSTEHYDTSMDGPRAAYMKLYAERLRAAIDQRVSKEPHTEIICLTWNGPQKDAMVGLPQFQVETGIGYEHAWSDYRVYESYAWMHMQMGKEGLQRGGKWYWAVIPNAFDLDDFRSAAKRGEDFLFMGRLNDDKGVGLAIDVAKRVDRKITIVGQGNPERFLGRGCEHVTYLKPVSGQARADLLASAAAVFTPSLYVEPFCGVHVEAMLCGTPVITTDWGVFNETVLHGSTGYRCRSIEQMVWAAKNIDKLELSHASIQNYARYNFSLARVALMYEEYFQNVRNLKYPKGLYTENPGRKQLDFLVRSTPEVAPVDLNVEFVAPEPPVEKKGWAVDQDWERDWWGLHWAPHWDEEIKKQQTYFRLMGLTDLTAVGSVLDVGCGPVSMLQRRSHRSGSRGVDPLAVSDETLERYLKAGVEFLNIKAEEMPIDRQFDEVWCYNCLQHTDDPNEILRRMAACTARPSVHGWTVGGAVRIFEWIDLGICPGHPQNLTEKMFADVFQNNSFDIQIWNVGQLRDFGGTVENKYIAIHAIRKR